MIENNVIRRTAQNEVCAFVEMQLKLESQRLAEMEKIVYPFIEGRKVLDPMKFTFTDSEAFDKVNAWCKENNIISANFTPVQLLTAYNEKHGKHEREKYYKAEAIRKTRERMATFTPSYYERSERDAMIDEFLLSHVMTDEQIKIAVLFESETAVNMFFTMPKEKEQLLQVVNYDGTRESVLKQHIDGKAIKEALTNFVTKKIEMIRQNKVMP